MSREYKKSDVEKSGAEKIDAETFGTKTYDINEESILAIKMR